MARPPSTDGPRREPLAPRGRRGHRPNAPQGRRPGPLRVPFAAGKGIAHGHHQEVLHHHLPRATTCGPAPRESGGHLERDLIPALGQFEAGLRARASADEPPVVLPGDHPRVPEHRQGRITHHGRAGPAVEVKGEHRGTGCAAGGSYPRLHVLRSVRQVDQAVAVGIEAEAVGHGRGETSAHHHRRRGSLPCAGPRHARHPECCGSESRDQTVAAHTGSMAGR